MNAVDGRPVDPAAPEPVPAAPTAGYVTAELAMALPTLLLILVASLYALSAQSLSGRCADAARAGARDLARGDDAAEVVRRVRAALPAGSTATVRREPALVGLDVSAPLPVPRPLRGMLADRRITARATAADESQPGPAP